MEEVVVTSVEGATSAVIIVTSVADVTSGAVMTSGEAVASAATPIDSVASCMVVTFVTAAPWAIAFAGRLSLEEIHLSAAAAAAAHQL